MKQSNKEKTIAAGFERYKCLLPFEEVGFIHLKIYILQEIIQFLEIIVINLSGNQTA